MREIKFRAWDESQKYMAYQGTADLETLQSFICHFGDKVLMQYTGLKDKNGKEIFEGDICNAQYNICDVYKKVPVYFHAGCFYVDDKSPVGNLPLNYFFNSYKEIEVIGNIYENPELGEKNDIKT